MSPRKRKNSGGDDSSKRKRPHALTAAYVRFARAYVEMTEALLREGVNEDIAREEARMTATTILFSERRNNAPPCPLCGN